MLLWVASFTVVCGFVAADLSFEADYAALLPAEAPETEDFYRMGGAWYGVVAIDQVGAMEAGQDEEIEHTAAELADRISRVEGIEFAQASPPRAFFEERILYFLTAEQFRAFAASVEDLIARERARQNPLYVDLEDPSEVALPRDLDIDERWERYVSEDGWYRYILFRPSFSPTDIERSRELFRSVDRAVAQFRQESDRDLICRFGGPHYSHLQEDDEIGADLVRAGSLSALLVALVVLVWARRLRALAILFVPVGISVVWTLAFAAVALGRLNVVSAFLVPILFGLGVDFGVHIAGRYREERSGGRGVEDAVVLAVAHTGRACLTAALTTMVAFLSLTLAAFRGFSEFGLIAAVGVLAALVSGIVLFPALIVMLDSDEAPPVKAAGAPAELPRCFVPLVVAILGIGSVGGALSIPAIGFETDLDELRGDSEALEFDRYLTRSLGGATAPSVFSVDGAPAEDTTRAALDPLPSVEFIVSARDLVPGRQSQRAQGMARLRSMLPDIAMIPEARRSDVAQLSGLLEAEPFGVADLPASLRARFEGGDRQILLASTTPHTSTIDGSIEWAKALEGLRHEVEQRGGSVRVLSGPAISGRLFATVLEDLPTVLVASLLGVFLMLVADLRSLRDALIVECMVVGGLLSTVGILGIADAKLNVFNVLIFPTLLGIGVDSAVHLVHRARADGRAGFGRALRRVGTASLVSSLTTLGGFGTLLIAHHRGIQSIGLLAVLGITAMWVTSIFGTAAVLRMRFEFPPVGK
ncbi:MAG: MMPL family transporter [Myxococcota bacterium]